MSAAKAMADELARVALAAMRGGPLLAVSPQRSEEILSAAFAQLIDASREAVAEVRAETFEVCAAICDEVANGRGERGAGTAAAKIRERGAS